ncbi:hypothetical protein A2714_04135 [Candidatus Woesebacteria bacterium RIFCSPHIGHO2_01_FULL_38_9]|uniref:Uncharacterized protein n=2 Tax=Candidatus Woeseibacteriota TaxID=1752722 RepID=A0A1F7Y3I9_9BACT|nr:MAG: hypothetical protein A2714_04135 [Candidatus Woesebacteria bacterium RIFCSPHIGHO2_01_FULL_38_9]OGM60568.1 MAG: hypothetical protein A3A75_03525 [Candidatus Woesebacteria bacterium RIFCSPLOWO2_01_FULL_39_10]
MEFDQLLKQASEFRVVGHDGSEIAQAGPTNVRRGLDSEDAVDIVIADCSHCEATLVADFSQGQFVPREGGLA